MNPSEMFEKLESMRVTVTEVNNQFQDPELTTFIPVMISEFLSLYETERLIQELTTYSIDVHAIVVNQLLFPEQGKRHLHAVPHTLTVACRDELQALPDPLEAAAKVLARGVRSLRRRLPHRQDVRRRGEVKGHTLTIRHTGHC